MKKLSTIFLAIVLMFAAYSAYADSPRMILLEEATSTYCGPCAGQNPTFQSYVADNLDRVVPIVYHHSYPGSGNDQFHKADPAMNTARISTYYGITGVPHVKVNGKAAPPLGQSYEGAPGDITSLNAYIDDLSGQTSPIDMYVTMTKDGNDATVNVQVVSSEDISGKKLRIVICTYEVLLDTPAPNGEDEFYWTARKMLPDANGVDFNITAGEQENFSHEFTMPSNWEGGYDEVYAVAFIQDDSNKDVLQAATNYVMGAIEGPENIYKVVDRQGSVEGEFTVSNPNPFPLDFDFTISDMPTGWSATLDKSSATIQGNSSETITCTVTSGTKAYFLPINIDVTPSSENNYNVGTSSEFYALTSDAKYCYYYNSNSLLAYNVQWLEETEYSDDYVFMPYTSSIVSAYNPTRFDLLMFNSRTVYTNQYSLIPQNQFGDIRALFNSNKPMFIFSDLTGWLSYHSQWSSDFGDYRNFYENQLGISFDNKIDRYSGNYLTAFDVQGVPGDDLGKFLPKQTLNGSVQQMALFTDIIKIENENFASPIYFYDDDQTHIAGVRVENFGSKVVYTTFDPGAIPNAQARAMMMEPVMDWLLMEGAPEPEITIFVTNVNFGGVAVGTTEEKSILVENSGNETLVITDVSVNADPDGVFGVTTEIGDGFEIPAKEQRQITINFTPAEEKDYTSNLSYLTITSNDPYNENISIQLKGKGGLERDNQAIDVVTDDWNFGQVDIESGNTITLTRTVRNVGKKELQVFVDFKEIDNPDNNAFEISDYSLIIDPLSEADLEITFDPDEEKTYTTVLVLASNDAYGNDELETTMIGEGTKEASSIRNGVAGDAGILTVEVGPNPCNDISTLTYNVGGLNAKQISIQLIDAQGNTVANLVDGQKAPGQYTLTINASDYASGNYFIIANTGDYSTQLPLVIVK